MRNRGGWSVPISVDDQFFMPDENLASVYARPRYLLRENEIPLVRYAVHNPSKNLWLDPNLGKGEKKELYQMAQDLYRFGDER